MALITCKECKGKMSSEASKCPKCGAPNHLKKNEKKWWIAFVLCWFVGIVGAHRYYMRQTTSAIVMTILTCTIVDMIVTAIWALVDFIVLLVHAGDDKWVNEIANSKK